jgi:hypothetical protein
LPPTPIEVRLVQLGLSLNVYRIGDQAFLRPIAAVRVPRKYAFRRFPHINMSLLLRDVATLVFRRCNTLQRVPESLRQ